MSNPTTPESSNNKKTKPKSNSKSKSRRKRRNSNNSNASIISIDPVSLKSLRKFQEKVAKENKKQKYLYRQQKKSQFEIYTKKFTKNELKEEDEYKISKPKHDIGVPSPYSDESSDKEGGTGTQKNVYNKMEDITVEELLPLIKNLVDRHNKLQTEYDTLDRQLREQKILMEDKISQLEQQQGYDDNNQSRNSMISNRTLNINKIREEYEDKMEILKNNYESNLLSIQSGYEQDIENQKKEIKSLNKELNDLEREIDALRQSLEALEHENQSLRISMNNNNKQFANVKLIKNKNKQLMLENDTLRQQIESLEQEMDLLMQEQQQIELEHKDQNDTNNRNLNEKPLQQGNIRPHTPQHNYGKTIMGGAREQLDASYKGSLLNLSDHDSSIGNDLLNQIGDVNNNDYISANQSSTDPPDRNSEYEDEDEDEKKINDNDSLPRDTILANLSKYKRDIADGNPDSMAQILALLQEKEHKRLGAGHSNPSQDVIDNYSVESNYSDSEQELKEQIDNIEDDIRELKDMVLSLMDSTNNLTPQINANLGPLVRKINRMYVMLSGGPGGYINPIGPSDSTTSEIGLDTDTDSQISIRKGSDKTWMAWITPYINDWMPSIGFSAIILSTMYLLIKYHKGRFIGIGTPRVLRKKRGL